MTKPPANDSTSALAALRIVGEENIYIATGEPVDAWCAIRATLEADYPLSESLIGYLRTTATRMDELSTSGIPAEGKIAPAIATALGFRLRGGTNPFRERSDEAHELLLAFDIRDEETKDLKHPGPKRAPLSQLYDRAAKAHVQGCDSCAKPPSAATMRRAWRHFGKMLSRRVDRTPVGQGRRRSAISERKGELRRLRAEAEDRRRGKGRVP